MKKRAPSLLLALVMCLGLGITAQAAGTVQSPSIETSMCFSSSARAACVLKSDGELWGYIFDPSAPNGIASETKLLTGACAFTSECSFGYPGLIGLALKADGTLYEIDLFWADTPAMKTSYITSDVVAVEQDCYLTASGDLYYYGYGFVSVKQGTGFGSHSSELVLAHERIAENVIDFAGYVQVPFEDNATYLSGATSPGYLAYVTADHVLHYGYDEKTMAGVRSIYFDHGAYYAITDRDELYSWGQNSVGQVGNGGDYDQIRGFVGMATNSYVSSPTKVMSNVSKMYFDDDCVYAEDKNGTLWQWGDAPERIQAGPSGGYIKPDSAYCSPRKSGTAQPSYRTVDHVEIKADGTLVVDNSGDDSWGGSGGQAGVVLPVRYSQVMTAGTGPTAPVQPSTTPPAQSADLAYASTQTVTVDGKAVEFQMYALKDASGNGTNYIKLRDMAYVLNGTSAQFAVGYDGTIALTTGQSYQAAGTEMNTPFSGDRAYTGGTQTVRIDGTDVAMTAITLLDDAGGGYNYFKLRDLGRALGFCVGWDADRGIFIETDEPYSG